MPADQDQKERLSVTAGGRSQEPAASTARPPTEAAKPRQASSWMIEGHFSRQGAMRRVLQVFSSDQTLAAEQGHEATQELPSPHKASRLDNQVEQ